MTTIKLLLFGLAVALCGCSHVSKIGTVGNREFYKVQATSLLGPSVVAIVEMRVGFTNDVTELHSYAGNGLAPAVVGSAGIVAGSALWGKSYRGENTVVAEDPPPAPMIVPPNRPPVTVPHDKPHGRWPGNGKD